MKQIDSNTKPEQEKHYREVAERMSNDEDLTRIDDNSFEWLAKTITEAMTTTGPCGTRTTLNWDKYPEIKLSVLANLQSEVDVARRSSIRKIF